MTFRGGSGFGVLLIPNIRGSIFTAAVVLSGSSPVPSPGGSSTILWDTRAAQAQDIQTASTLSAAQSQGNCTLQFSNCSGGWSTDIGDGNSTKGFFWTLALGSQNNWQVFNNPHWHGRVLIVQSKYFCPAGFTHNAHKFSVQVRELINDNITTQEGRWTTIYDSSPSHASTVFINPELGGMAYTTLTGTPVLNETLNFIPSGATAKFDHTSSSGPTVYYSGVVGTPAGGDTIYGLTSGCIFSGTTKVQSQWGAHTGSITDPRQHGSSFAGDIWAGDGWGTFVDLNSSPYIGTAVRKTDRFTASSFPDLDDGSYECWLEGNGVVTKVMDIQGLRTGTLGYGETEIGGPVWTIPPQVQTWYHYDFRSWGESSPVPAEPTGFIVDWLENFESYADITAFKAAYATAESHGTLSLDGSAHAGSKCLGVNYNNDGCLGANDAKVGFEKALGLTNNTIYVSYWRKWQPSPAYQFVRSDLGTCTRGNASKELQVFRDSNNTGGKISGTIQQTGYYYPDFSATEYFGKSFSGPVWSWEPEAEAGSPFSNAPAYRAFIGNGLYDFQNLLDGLWHRITYQYTKSTTPTGGDGKLGLWIDGKCAAWFDGTDPTRDYYNKVQTTTMGWYSFTFAEIYNAGTAQAQTSWFDDMKIGH